MYLMFASLVPVEFSAFLPCLSLGVCSRLNGYIGRMEEDEQKMMLLTSFCLLSSFLGTHSESADGGSNSSYDWEKQVCRSSSRPLDYFIIQDVCLYLSVLVQGLWRIADTLPFGHWIPLVYVDNLKKYIFIHTWLKKRHCIKLDEVGVFMDDFTFSFIPTEK